jgi:hypothetical protein
MAANRTNAPTIALKQTIPTVDIMMIPSGELDFARRISRQGTVGFDLAQKPVLDGNKALALIKINIVCAWHRQLRQNSPQSGCLAAGE